MFNTKFTAMGDTAIVTDDETPNVRYVVWQDTDSDDPRDWSDTTEAQTLVYRAAYRTGNADADASSAATGTMAAFIHAYDATGDATKALRAATLYAAMFEPDYSVETYSATGYTQGEWWELVSVVKDGYGTPKDHAETFEQWTRGDVWCVMEETLTECDNPENCHGDEESHWQAGDSLGGIYADDPEDAAREYQTVNP